MQLYEGYGNSLFLFFIYYSRMFFLVFIPRQLLGSNFETGLIFSKIIIEKQIVLIELLVSNKKLKKIVCTFRRVFFSLLNDLESRGVSFFRNFFID